MEWWDIEVSDKKYTLQAETRVKAQVEGARMYIKEVGLQIYPTSILYAVRVRKVDKKRAMGVTLLSEINKKVEEQNG